MKRINANGVKKKKKKKRVSLVTYTNTTIKNEDVKNIYNKLINLMDLGS